MKYEEYIIKSKEIDEKINEYMSQQQKLMKFKCVKKYVRLRQEIYLLNEQKEHLEDEVED